MAKVGDYSDPVIGQNGVHVLYYLADMEGGLVMTDEIHQEISDYLVSNKVNEAYNAGLETWKPDMNIVTYQDALDAAQAQADAEAAEEEAAAQATAQPEADSAQDDAAATDAPAVQADATQAPAAN